MRGVLSLSPVSFLFGGAPIAEPAAQAHELTQSLICVAAKVRMTIGTIHDWLRIEFGLDRPGRALASPERLDADAFAAAVRAALPRRRTLSVAEIARLKREHAETVVPAREAAQEVQLLERRLSDLVNAAYGLTPEEVALMWSTAPPRMPIAAPTAGRSPEAHVPVGDE